MFTVHIKLTLWVLGQCKVLWLFKEMYLLTLSYFSYSGNAIILQNSKCYELFV